MRSKLRSRVIAPILGLVLICLGSVQAGAQQYTIATTFGTFNVQLVGEGQSYNGAITDVAGDPNLFDFEDNAWWGSEARAEEVAFLVSEADGLRTDPDITYRAAYNLINSGADVQYRQRGDIDGFLVGVTASQQTRSVTSTAPGGAGFFGSFDQQAWITQVVPEIDGPVLAQALFVLGALFAWRRGVAGRRTGQITGQGGQGAA